MTRILVPRGSASGSSSNTSRSGSSSGRTESQVSPLPQAFPTVKDEENGEQTQEQDELLDYSGSTDNKLEKSDDHLSENVNNDCIESSHDDTGDTEKLPMEENIGSGDFMKGLDGLRISERSTAGNENISGDLPQVSSGRPQPPPPPVPPPKPLAGNSNLRRTVSVSSNAARSGSSRRAVTWPVPPTRTSPSGSRPSSPRSHVENEGYNSADEQSPCFVSSYDDVVSFWCQ